MMPKDRLKTMAEGIFFSLLTYGIQVYGGVWGLDTLNFDESRTRSFTKEDNHNLQVIMNKVQVCLLLEKSGYLSMQQLTAYHTLVTTFKVLQNKEPVYIYDALIQSRNSSDRTRAPTVFQPNYQLSTTRQSFMYRAQKLFNLLPENVSSSENPLIFKKSVKPWIKLNIPAMPP